MLAAKETVNKINHLADRSSTSFGLVGSFPSLCSLRISNKPMFPESNFGYSRRYMGNSERALQLDLTQKSEDCQ